MSTKDMRYYGIYRGVVVSTTDPLGKGRVALKVPQISGDEITNWAWPIIGVPENRKVPYGSFYDFTNQFAGNKDSTSVGDSTYPPAANTPISMRLGYTDTTTTQFVYVDGGDNTKITFKKAGIYNFQWSAQFVNTDVALSDVSVWLRQNGVDLDGSTGLVSIPNSHAGGDGHSITGWNYLINAKANDYIELWWTCNKSNTYIATYPASTSPVYPSTASVVATVDLVGGFNPVAGDPCWVMFEGGNPNFPLWLGTF